MVIKQEPRHEDSDDSDTVSTCSTSGDVAVIHRNPVEDLSSYGNISVVDSSNVHFGNRTFYQGPVTIKQLVYTDGEANDLECLEAAKVKGPIVLDPADLKNGIVNSGFSDNSSDGKNNKDELKPQVTDNSTIKKSITQFRTLCKNHLYVIASVLAVLIIAFTVLLVILFTKQVPDYELSTDVNLSFPLKLSLIRRSEWLARPPRESLTPLKLPVHLVIIQHTATVNCSSQDCKVLVRNIQKFHVYSRNWSDIGYNFLVGGDGRAYEGRGWEIVGAHTLGYNNISIGIAFMGTFIDIPPPEKQLWACQELINKGVKQGYITNDYKLVGALQLQGTESPGRTLFNILKTWPHYVERLN